jgi:hypothetical protein
MAGNNNAIANTGTAMIFIALMLLVLTVSFVLFGGLVRFSENIIRPSSAPSANHPDSNADGAKAGAEA